MKANIAIVILIVVTLGLGVALVTKQRKHAQERKERDGEIALQSQNLQKTTQNLEEQKQVNMTLESDLKTRADELKTVSNNLSKAINDLEKTDAQAKATAEQLRTAQAEMAKKDQKIGEMESERLALGKQMDQLTNAIGDLEKLIAVTEKKLSTARGEKDFLVQELTRLRAEKTELEHQFNDLAVLRTQVSRVKEGLAISRRLEFIRLNPFGVTTKGGAGRLMANENKPVRGGGTNYDLSVEVRQTGSARVVGPTNMAGPQATNAPRPAVANPAIQLKDAPAAPLK